MVRLELAARTPDSRAPGAELANRPMPRRIPGAVASGRRRRCAFLISLAGVARCLRSVVDQLTSGHGGDSVIDGAVYHRLVGDTLGFERFHGIGTAPDRFAVVGGSLPSSPKEATTNVRLDLRHANRVFVAETNDPQAQQGGFEA